MTVLIFEHIEQRLASTYTKIKVASLQIFVMGISDLNREMQLTDNEIHASDHTIILPQVDMKLDFVTWLSCPATEMVDGSKVQYFKRFGEHLMTFRQADLFSESQRIQFTIKQRTDGIQDARLYLLALKDIRLKRGLTDELGTEAIMMDALEKVEKDIKKPLARNDKKGMALLTGEFNKINQK
ncbi:probable ATP synthase 24 kDa subunit, mitochondrial [Tanacetum coccineum]